MDRHVTLIFGRSGEGKTTLAERLTLREKKLFVIDNLAEYTCGLIWRTYRDLERHHRFDRAEFRSIARFTTDEEIESLFRLVYEIGDCTLLAEECDWYAPTHGKRSKTFMRIVKYGRHQGVSIIGVCRRPAEITTHLRSQATRVITFHQELEIDAKYLAGLGFHPKMVMQLEQFHYLAIDRRRTEQQRKVA